MLYLQLFIIMCMFIIVYEFRCLKRIYFYLYWDESLYGQVFAINCCYMDRLCIIFLLILYIQTSYCERSHFCRITFVFVLAPNIQLLRAVMWVRFMALIAINRIPRGNNVRSSIGIFGKHFYISEIFRIKLSTAAYVYVRIHEYQWLCYVQQTAHREKPILILSSLIRNMHVHCTARSLQTLLCCVFAWFSVLLI